jgi:hypothetical protein
VASPSALAIIMNRSSLAVGVILSVFATNAEAQASSSAVDTVDIAVGSKALDFSAHIPGTTRTYQEMTMGTQKRTAPPIIWRFTTVDTGGAHLLIVRGGPEQSVPNMPAQPEFVFDRQTMTLKQSRDPVTLAPQLSVDGTHVHGQTIGPNGPVPIDATLTTPAFFAPLADLVTESLPRKLGVVYRVPLWDVRTPGITTHLYQMVRREEVTILGKTYHDAWVLEDHNADGSKLLGTMWLVDASPFLVRWVINLPTGGVVRLDQEAVDSRR